MQSIARYFCPTVIWGFVCTWRADISRDHCEGVSI